MYAAIYLNIIISAILIVIAIFFVTKYGYNRQGSSSSNLILTYILIALMINATYGLQAWYRIPSDTASNPNSEVLDTINNHINNNTELAYLDTDRQHNEPKSTETNILSELMHRPSQDKGIYISINTDYLTGQINLHGGNIHSLGLKKYSDKHNQQPKLINTNNHVTMLFMDLYDVNNKQLLGLDNQMWHMVLDDSSYQEDKQITLTTDNAVTIQIAVPTLGLVRRTFSIVDDYLLQITDVLVNNTTNTLILHAYAKLSRPVNALEEDSFFARDQIIGWVNNQMHFIEYEDLFDKTQIFKNNNQWLAFSDVNWLVGVVIDKNISQHANMLAMQNKKNNTYDLAYITQSQIQIEPNQQQTIQNWRVLAMAKEESLLQYYEQDLAIKDLTQTKDWGWLSFINFYLFQILQMINKVVQNYGWSIIILTVLIRILLLPLMFKVQQSSRIMRILKPKIQNIREIYKDQPEQMNQKILDIYRQHKINPLISIIFILPQIPIMYSIWSLTQDIIFNNQPFILWMDNMYVRDSYVLIDFTSMGIILTLLGLLTSLSMYLGLIHTINQNIQMSMHTKITLLIILSFLLSYLTVGMAIYLICNNLLTPIQNWIINRILNKDDKQI